MSMKKLISDVAICLLSFTNIAIAGAHGGTSTANKPVAPLINDYRDQHHHVLMLDQSGSLLQVIHHPNPNHAHNKPSVMTKLIENHVSNFTVIGSTLIVFDRYGSIQSMPVPWRSDHASSALFSLNQYQNIYGEASHTQLTQQGHYNFVFNTQAIAMISPGGQLETVGNPQYGGAATRTLGHNDYIINLQATSHGFTYLTHAGVLYGVSHDMLATIIHTGVSQFWELSDGGLAYVLKKAPTRAIILNADHTMVRTTLLARHSFASVISFPSKFEKDIFHNRQLNLGLDIKGIMSFNTNKIPAPSIAPVQLFSIPSEVASGIMEGSECELATDGACTAAIAWGIISYGVVKVFPVIFGHHYHKPHPSKLVESNQSKDYFNSLVQRTQTAIRLWPVTINPNFPVKDLMTFGLLAQIRANIIAINAYASAYQVNDKLITKIKNIENLYLRYLSELNHFMAWAYVQAAGSCNGSGQHSGSCSSTCTGCAQGNATHGASSHGGNNGSGTSGSGTSGSEDPDDNNPNNNIFTLPLYSPPIPDYTWEKIKEMVDIALRSGDDALIYNFFRSEPGNYWIHTIDGANWLHSEAGQKWLSSAPGQQWHRQAINKGNKCIDYLEPDIDDGPLYAILKFLADCVMDLKVRDSGTDSYSGTRQVLPTSGSPGGGPGGVPPDGVPPDGGAPPGGGPGGVPPDGVPPDGGAPPGGAGPGGAPRGGAARGVAAAGGDAGG